MLKSCHKSSINIPVRSIRYKVCYSEEAKKSGRKQGMLISFDYAIKFLLKNKADFYVVEDFISSLLELVGYPKVKILTVKDPENQKSLSTTKITIPDLLVEDETGKHYLIEIEKSFFSDAGYKAHYNTSYATVHHFIDKGGDFSKIEKVLHISILYEAYGNVNDYLYHGKTEPRGINTHQKLMIQKNIGGRKHNTLEDLPEYFYVFPENFHESFKSKFDEWVHMLKTGEIRSEAFDKYRDLKKVEKRLDYLNLNDSEKREFDKLQANRAKESCKLKDAKEKGREEGLEKGREEGLEKGREEGLEKGLEKGREEGLEKGLEKGREEGEKKKALDMAQKLVQEGMSLEKVAKIAGLDVEDEEVQALDQVKVSKS